MARSYPVYRSWQIGIKTGRHWAEVLFNERLEYLNTPNMNSVTYALMMEDERQYRIAEANSKSGRIVFDADAEMRARYTMQGRDFDGELMRIKLIWR